MGKAFKRLEKQVGDRRHGAARQRSWASRIASVEVYLLEVGAYLQTIAVDKDSPSDSALAEAHRDFVANLEGTLQK